MDVISSGIIDLITRISKLIFALPALFRCSQTVNDFIWLLGQCYAGMCDFLYQTNVITSFNNSTDSNASSHAYFGVNCNFAT
jgi:hypothetical protein